MRKNHCAICPDVLKKLNASIMDSKIWIAIPCGDLHRSVFEVSRRHEKFVVNLKRHTCTCRIWDISGIPCKHAIAAVDNIGGKHEDFVSEYFKKENFLKTYGRAIKRSRILQQTGYVEANEVLEIKDIAMASCVMMNKGKHIVGLVSTLDTILNIQCAATKT
ncbi:FAR1-related sequence 1 [Striga asiatica]|uniref:FAR1-related sequence 1 n=1 Tax=Striga asiatica TaxID=4170 RepID=A0A5A7PU69_STRAF|nr:FAR1-related sequence 1 [Striga asiatica]